MNCSIISYRLCQLDHLINEWIRGEGFIHVLPDYKSTKTISVNFRSTPGLRSSLRVDINFTRRRASARSPVWKIPPLSVRSRSQPCVDFWLEIPSDRSFFESSGVAHRGEFYIIIAPSCSLTSDNARLSRA